MSWKERAEVVESADAGVEPTWKAEAEVVDEVAAPAPEGDGLPRGGDGWFEPASTSGTALRSFGKGASSGFTDELSGATNGLAAGFSRVGIELAKTKVGRALARKLRPELEHVSDVFVDAAIEESAQDASAEIFGMKLPLDADDALHGVYRHNRDEMRLETLQGRKANPKTALGMQVVGSVMGPGPKAKTLGGISKQMAGYGAAAGLGESEGNFDTKEGREELLTDTAFGGAFGGVAGPAGTVVGRNAARMLKKSSLVNALKAMKGSGGITNVLTDMGYKNEDEALELAEAAMQMGLIKPFGTSADVLRKTLPQKEFTGARIEGVLKDAQEGAAKRAAGIQSNNLARRARSISLSQRQAAEVAERNAANRAAAKPGAPTWDEPIPEAAPTWDEPIPPEFDMKRASWDATENVMDVGDYTTEAMHKAGPAAGIVERIAEQAEVGDTFSAANKLKSNIYEGINYKLEPGLSTNAQRRAASGLRQSIEDQVAEQAGPEVADELRSANQRWGQLSDIEKLSTDESTRQLNKQTPWTSAIRNAFVAGGAGAAGGGATTGAMGGAAAGALGFMGPLVARGLGPRIPSLLANTGRALSKPMQSTGIPRIQQGIQSAEWPLFDAIQRPTPEQETKSLKESLSKEDEDAVSAFLRAP